MISLLIFALIIIVVCAVAIYIVRMLPLAAPWGNVACAIIALIGLLVFLSRVYPGLGR